MTALRIGYIAELLRRPLVVRGSDHLEDPGANMGGRFLATLAGRRWQQAPPLAELSNHLRRDIGLPPVRHARDWRWHR